MSEEKVIEGSDIVELVMQMFKLRYNDPTGVKPFIAIIENAGLEIVQKGSGLNDASVVEDMEGVEVLSETNASLLTTNKALIKTLGEIQALATAMSKPDSMDQWWAVKNLAEAAVSSAEGEMEKGAWQTISHEEFQELTVDGEHTAEYQQAAGVTLIWESPEVDVMRRQPDIGASLYLKRTATPSKPQ